MKSFIIASLALILIEACSAPSMIRSNSVPLSLALPGGHTTPVTKIVFSPSGQYFATASYDTLVKVWDSRTHEVLADLRGHSRPVYTTAFSPDEKTVASAGPGGTIRIWDWRHARLLKELRGLDTAVGALVFSPDGTILISGGDDAAIRLWSCSDGEIINKLEGHRGPVLTLALSPDGKYLLSGGTDGQIIVWRCKDWKEVNRWTMPALVADISFSPKGNQVAAALRDKTIQILRFPDGESQTTLSGHEGLVKGVSWSPDASHIASISWDGSLRIWDTVTAQQTSIFYPQGKLQGLTVAWHPLDPNQVLTGGWNYVSALKPVDTTEPSSSLHIWDILTNKRKKALPCQTSPLYSLAVSKVHRLLACGSQQTGLQHWQISRQKPLSLHLKKVSTHRKPIWSVAFHPNKPYLLHTTVNGEIWIWNMATNKRERVIVMKDFMKSPVLSSIAVSPDGKLIAAAGDWKIFLIDFETGGLLHTYKSQTGKHGTLTFHPEGKILAAADGTNILLLYTAEDRKHGWLDKILSNNKSEVRSLAFSPSGGYLCSIDRSGSVKIWNPHKGVELADWQMKDKERPLNGKTIIYDPKGVHIVAGSSSGEIAIYHLFRQEEILQIKAHGSSVNALAFSPDGKVLFSTGDDHLLKAWRFPEMVLMFTTLATKDGKGLVQKPRQ